MKKQKISFDELANQANQLNKEQQAKVLGGRRGRGTITSWGWDRGGIIDDDLVIRYDNSLNSGGK